MQEDLLNIQLDEEMTKKSTKIPQISAKVAEPKDESKHKHKFPNEKICVRCHQLRYQGKVRKGVNIDKNDFWPKLTWIFNNGILKIDILIFHSFFFIYITLFLVIYLLKLLLIIF